MAISSLWIIGTSRTGKTTRLVAEFSTWAKTKIKKTRGKSKKNQNLDKSNSAVLVFAANDDNKRDLTDKLSASIQGSYPVICKTLLGFMADEVKLFWPLIFEKLALKAQFPLRLRPETEQELATRLWHAQIEGENLRHSESEYRLVRRTLDLLQLAGASGIPAEDIATILEQGLPDGEKSFTEAFSTEEAPQTWKRMGELLLEWREWCLQRGLLSYGLIYELYWRYLLTDANYQHHLSNRYQAIFADDLDDYPAIARNLIEFFLDRHVFCVLTYNPHGKIRLGLNADPNYIAGLASRCQIEQLDRLEENSLESELADLAIELIQEPIYITRLPESIQSIQEISRAKLLRTTAQIITKAIKNQEVQPKDVVVIAPGLDEIARYTLMEILTANGIPVAPLNEQRPLISSPLIRALLTLLCLIYPGLGRLLNRDEVAEMLVVLSNQSKSGKLTPDIDPVRAGLLADSCYYADIEQPLLLSVESFNRWDRLGYKATAAYVRIVEWIEAIKKFLQQQDRLLPATIVLDRAIKELLNHGSNLPLDRMSALRELTETAQHYWDVDLRLRQNEPNHLTQTATVERFVLLLRRGTITANPRPITYLAAQENAVTLANIFQYRSLRRFHRWQFWLDTGSHFWERGGSATLFAAPLFLKEWSGRTWMPEDSYEDDRQRLERIMRDLTARAGERIYLCHSDLGVNGTEQMGALVNLVHASRQFVDREMLMMSK